MVMERFKAVDYKMPCAGFRSFRLQVVQCWLRVIVGHTRMVVHGTVSNAYISTPYTPSRVLGAKASPTRVSRPRCVPRR